jgi:hypothetical protein
MSGHTYPIATTIFRTPYSSQCELAVISKIIFKLVPGKVVSVWFNSEGYHVVAMPRKDP